MERIDRPNAADWKALYDEEVARNGKLLERLVGIADDSLDAAEAVRRAIVFTLQLSDKDIKRMLGPLAGEGFIRALEQDGYTVVRLDDSLDAAEVDRWWAERYAAAHVSGAAGYQASREMTQRANALAAKLGKGEG